MSGEFYDALDHLKAAVALWRGPAGLDVTVDGRIADRLSLLNDHHLAAKESLAAARLARGETRGALAELDALATACPTRECTAQLQVVARYRCGDVAGALAAYRKARSALVEFLGVEPGASLNRLHHAALERDERLLNDNRLLAQIAAGNGILV